MAMLTIACFILNLIISFPLCFVIVKFISNKTVLSVSLIDFIYRDAIIYLYLLCCTASAGFIHCLLNEDSLSFTLSATYSGCAMFFVDCLCISLLLSGSLKMISLLRNSEVGGLLLFGPENIAIVKIRLISILISFSFQIVKFCLNAHSGLFNMFYESETKFYLEEILANKFKALNFVWLVSSIFVNVLTKLISYKLNKTLNPTVPVFTIEQQPVATTGTFVFSFLSVIGFPILLLIASMSSYVSRNNRLMVFYTVQLTIISTVLPLQIIYKNKKLKIYFINILIVPIKDKLTYIYLEFKRMTSSNVSPLFV
jgi:hypothetical protein